MSMHTDEDTRDGEVSTAQTGWGVETSFDMAAFNADLVDGDPTVDIGIFYPDNLDAAHHRRVSLETVIEGLVEAQRIFREAGVQLALVSVRTGRLNPALFSVHADAPGSELPEDRYANRYVERQRRPAPDRQG